MDATFQRSRYFGPTRQRGSGLGSAALRMGRYALPLLEKYVIPTAKRVGKEFIHNLTPEVAQVIQGREKPIAALEKAVVKTYNQEVAHRRSSSRRGRPPTSRSKPKTTQSIKGTKKRKVVISSKKPVKYSRSKKSSLFTNLKN